MRAAKDQARQHIRAVSPVPLQIILERMDVDEGLGQIPRPVQESLVLIAYVNSESLKKKGFR